MAPPLSSYGQPLKSWVSTRALAYRLARCDRIQKRGHTVGRGRDPIAVGGKGWRKGHRQERRGLVDRILNFISPLSVTRTDRLPRTTDIDLSRDLCGQMQQS